MGPRARGGRDFGAGGIGGCGNLGTADVAAESVADAENWDYLHRPVFGRLREDQEPNIWKQLNVNPLTCHPQSMGQQSNGQCFPLQGATMVAQQNGTCYYCVPQVPQGTLYIPMDQVQNASVQGYTCRVAQGLSAAAEDPATAPVTPRVQFPCL